MKPRGTGREGRTVARKRPGLDVEDGVYVAETAPLDLFCARACVHGLHRAELST